MRLYRLVVGLVAGVGLLVVGALSLSDTAVKCGPKVMQPGTVCATTTRAGTTTRRTYDQQRAYDRRSGLLFAGGGLVVTVACGLALTGMVRRRRATSQPVAGPFAGP